MIQIKLKEVAQRLGKSVTDIASDTGLNRNTVTALYHSKVDGIRFDTLEKICSVYGLAITDLLEVSKPAQQTVTPEPEKLYKQEGSLVSFTCFPWMVAINDLAPEFFPFGFGYLKTYFKESYGEAYWDHDSLYKLARFIYETYGKTGTIEQIYKKYETSAEGVVHIYKEADFMTLVSMTADELTAYFHELWGAGYKFWQYGAFIDAFDPGLDHDEIGLIAEKLGLTKEEVSVLTTPVKPTFNNERLLALLRLLRPLAKKKLVGQALKDEITAFVSESPAARGYMKEFDYYKSNYAFIKPITREEVREEAEKLLSDLSHYEAELKRLERYEAAQKAAIKKVLAAHKLKENPLEFFALLTYWREDRKKVNLMSICVYDLILRAVEEKTGIPKRYLQYATPEEIPAALRGLVRKDTLAERRESGVLYTFEPGSYSFVTGQEATSVHDELEAKLKGESTQEKTIYGRTACQGYAKGIARVILDESEFGKMKEGDILVTGMTRPEFVPIMKKAAGIVTNEGGITCHAAIISRELGIPCIIGTQKATRLIKDGDLVEVRANHATVRILN